MTFLRFLSSALILGTLTSALDAQALFDAPLTLPAGFSSVAPGPRSVATADLTGDGIPDLVAVHSGTNEIGLLGGDGIGGFQSLGRATTGADPRHLRLVDMDGDGRKEAVVTLSGAGAVQVWGWNQSAFTLEGTFNVGTDPRSTEAVDFDGDGRIDLASGSNGDGSITIGIQDALGGFRAPLTITTGLGSGCRELSAGDLDGDGDPDLVAAYANFNAVVVIENLGAGQFRIQSTLTIPTGLVNGVKLRDVDGDGAVDMVVSSFLAPSITVLSSTGALSFAAPVAQAGGVHFQGLELADVDYDGDADVIAVDVATNAVAVLANDGLGSFALQASLSAGSYPASVAVGDFDGDLATDILVPNFTAEALTLLRNAVPFPVLAEYGRGTTARDDLLQIDGNTGGAARRVVATAGGSVIIQLDSVAAGTPAPFILWAQIGAPSARSLTTIPLAGVGEACLIPATLAPGEPTALTLVNSFFGDPTAILAPSLTPYLMPIGLPTTPFRATFQAFVVDPTGNFRLSNGLLLDVL